MRAASLVATCTFAGLALAAATALADDDDAIAGIVIPADEAVPFYERPLLRLGGHPRDGYDDILVPEPLDLPYREIVNPERYVPGSLSFGHTSHGYLLRSARLPVDGEHHYVLPEHRGRGTHYGTEELIALLLDVSQRVNAQFPDTRTAVGNMSTEGGGDIPWSRSHNTGRDADIAFFFVGDETDESVELSTLIASRRNGRPRSGEPMQFDYARNWAVVEALLTSEVAQVQWIFVYDPLRRRLLDYAEEHGVSPELIALASEVMHQPGDSAPHNDHYHVRVYCSREDRLEGCINWGPRRNYADYYDEDMERRVRELLRGLMDPESEVAEGCIDFLDRLQPREHASVIASAVPHQSTDVQIALMDLLGELDQPGVTGPIVPLAESSPDNAVREKAFWLMGRLADPASAPALAGVMNRDGRPLPDGTSLREASAEALRNITNEAIVPDLLEALADPRPRVREAVQRVLRRTTGYEGPVDAGRDLGPDDFEALITQWQTWYAAHADLPRSEWLSSSFEDAGYAVGDLADAPALAELVRATEDDSDTIRFNADRQLMLLTGFWTPSEGWSRERRVAFWQDRVGIDD